MPEWHQAKNEILLALYNYQLMSPRQLSILLGYEKSSIYRVGKHLLKQELVRSVVLPFLTGNSRAYALTRQGAKIAWQLIGDAAFFTGKLWDEAPVQLAHSYGANEFFIRLIERSLHHDHEGLAEWLGPRDAGDRYAQYAQGSPNKKKLPLKPDGVGTYWLADGRRLSLHLEYDTGSESLYRLQEKLWNYAIYLHASWEERITQIPIMVVTRGARRVGHIFSLWKSLKQGPLLLRQLPMLLCANEDNPAASKNGYLWTTEDGTTITLDQLSGLPPRQEESHFLGKQVRKSLFCYS